MFRYNPIPHEILVKQNLIALDNERDKSLERDEDQKILEGSF